MAVANDRLVISSDGTSGLDGLMTTISSDHSFSDQMCTNGGLGDAVSVTGFASNHGRSFALTTTPFGSMFSLFASSGVMNISVGATTEVLFLFFFIGRSFVDDPESTRARVDIELVEEHNELLDEAASGDAYPDRRAVYNVSLSNALLASFSLSSAARS
jgi:hypothetical protein